MFRFSNFTLWTRSTTVRGGTASVLDILCRRLKDESADLVYLDSSFNPAQSYGVVEKSGSAAASQIHAFEDN